MKLRNKYLLALLALTVLGGILRAWPVFSTPLWFDEADTWRSGIIDPATSGWNEQTGLYEPVAMSYKKFFNWTNHFETAPLTFLLSRISCDLFGTTAEWAMRMPSLIAGILCIPAAFWLGRVVRGDVLGVITAGIIAYDPSQVDQSQQCRMYTLMMLFMLLAIALTIKLLREPPAESSNSSASLAPTGSAGASPSQLTSPSRSSPATRWLLWTLTGVCYGLLLWCTQFNVAVWVGIAMGAGALVGLGFVTGRPHRNFKGVAIGLTYAYILGLLVANVGVLHIINRATSGEVGDRPDLTYGEMAREIAVAAQDLINLGKPGLIVYVLAGLGLLLLFKKCKTSTAILAGVALANVIILFRFLRIHHFMDGRYLTCIQPAVFIGLGMLAVGFASKRLRLAGLAVVAAFIAVQGWQSTNLSRYYQQPDRYVFPHVIQHVRDTMKPGETAAIFPGVGCILGQYYRLPMDPKLFTGFYKMEDHLPREEQKVPADLKATAVHLVLGMHNYDTSDGRQKKMREATIQRIAAHYGVKAEQAELDKHIKQRRVVRAYISREGVKLESVGVE